MKSVSLLSIQVGLPQLRGRAGAEDAMDRQWTTGFYKKSIAGPVLLEQTNLVGDGQADLKHHGGIDKAVNVYPVEHYEYWSRELGIDGLVHGGFGENFTIGGLLEADVCIGDKFEIGGALVQVSQPRQPCWKLARRWRVKDLALRVQESGRTGWYLRVLREGVVEAGNGFVPVEKGNADWSVAAANAVMHVRKCDRDAALELAACAGLSASWRETLLRRAGSGEVEDASARLEGVE